MTTTYDLLVAHPFLAGMPLRHLERLSHWATRAPFHAGTRILSEHGRAQGFCLRARPGARVLSPGRPW